MKEIMLTRDKVALVDDVDYDRINQYKWQAADKGWGFYAQMQLGPRVGRKTIQMARMVMGLKAGDKRVVDHINHNTLDNRRSNLRVCFAAENHKNLRSFTGKSNFKGVYPHSNGKNWIAQIGVAGRVLYLGCFRMEELAALAYDFAALKYHREFANFNF